MKKRVFHRVIVITVMLVLGLATWSYAGPNWKEEQAKMFSQISVKPGDSIDASNWQKVADLLPSYIANWVKTGDMVMKIGEMKYDYDVDAEWKAATDKNEGKYDLDEGLEIRDKSTGKIATYIYGSPFPNIDFDKDPNAAIKLAHNIAVQRGRCGNLRTGFGIDWLNKKTGFERRITVDFFAAYTYGAPGGEKPNPQGYMYLNYTNIKEPSDLEGMITLTKRYLDNRVDDFYAYVPAIRRVKRLSGSSRSDPFAGSDFTNDGEQGWAGKNTSMKWKYLSKKITLIPVQEKSIEMPIGATKLPNGAWKVNSSGGEEVLAVHEVQGAKGAPWIPVNVKWVPRYVYELEAIPVDPYYNWGKIGFYVDPAVGFCYTITYDKSMTYWKTLLNVPMCVEWGEPKRRTFSSSSCYFAMDEKTQHGCLGYFLGMHHGKEFTVIYNDPTLTERDFSEGTMATKSR
ncbi:MAG: DUF1329 domain-containing protein [Syntrophobacteraceae bacterium]